MKYNLTLSSIVLIICLCGISTSCEQEKFEPNLSVAPGGGTISTYKAYTLSSKGGSEVYGRIVFWKDNAGNTLLQMGLYNTVATEVYSSAIFNGPDSGGSDTPILSLYAVDGATGAFAPSKFYVIADKEFYDQLDSYNASVKVMVGSTAVASGDIGSNAEPVAVGG
jgi:hypothetical protein